MSFPTPHWAQKRKDSATAAVERLFLTPNGPLKFYNDTIDFFNIQKHIVFLSILEANLI